MRKAGYNMTPVSFADDNGCGAFLIIFIETVQF